MAFTQVISAAIVAGPLAYGALGATLSGSLIAKPAGQPTDEVVVVVWRKSGITVNGSTAMSDPAYVNDINALGGAVASMNIWRAQLSALAPSSTLTETQITNGGVVVMLVYRFTDNIGLSSIVVNGGPSATIPTITGQGAGLGTKKDQILFFGSQGVQNIIPATGALYGLDGAFGDVAVARGPYSNTTGAPGATGIPAPSPSAWVMIDSILTQPVAGPGSVPPFLASSPFPPGGAWPRRTSPRDPTDAQGTHGPRVGRHI